MANPYNTHLDKNPANFQPLTPLSFLARTASVFPQHTAIIHGSLKRNYLEFYQRSRQLASSLTNSGIRRGDTVSVMLANTPAMLEGHYGVPMSGGVLHSINTRLDAAVIGFQLEHVEAKIVIVDSEFLPLMKQALAIAKISPLLIEYRDSEYEELKSLPASEEVDYEEFLSKGDPEFDWLMP